LFLRLTTRQRHLQAGGGIPASGDGPFFLQLKVAIALAALHLLLQLAEAITSAMTIPLAVTVLLLFPLAMQTLQEALLMVVRR
jgi:hypothetical protein